MPAPNPAPALLVAAVLLAACGDAPPPGAGLPTGPDAPGAAPTGTSPPPGADPDATFVDVGRRVPRDAPVAETVAGLRAFGHALHGQAGAPEANTVLSPLSVAYALAMARAGAAGDTATEIDEVLRFPARGLHDAFNILDREIVTQQGPPEAPAPDATRDAGDDPQPPVVAIANGLFAQEGFPVEMAFLEKLAASYGVGIERVDFGDAAASETIDAWVREQTAGRIDRLFDRLDPAKRLALANATYLKADWASPFARYPTEPDTFTRADGSTVEVAMMHDLGPRRWAAGAGWRAAELAYAGAELAMWVVVPDDPAEVTAMTAPAVLDGLADGLRPGQVDVFLPQWDFATDLDLMGALRTLGLAAPFGPAADFSRLSPQPLSISAAIHRANITVDEYGTEAAAVTGLGFAVSEPAGPDAVVRADRPFAFAIVHLPTGSPVFVGHVADPRGS